MQETVIEIFEDVLGTDEIREDLDLNLFETELLDSLAIIEVLLEIENRLGIELQP
ncbi:TPA: D-alanine--poly(phosphoribitol) ligase subunit 2, partial [Clostridioides difficile]|nr:D-alanine--poly(phosphoribitol) ligase subunit 2 [Clostridioides difficile]